MILRDDEDFKYLSKWLGILTQSKLFKSIINKYDVWDFDFKGVLVKWK